MLETQILHSEPQVGQNWLKNTVTLVLPRLFFSLARDPCYVDRDRKLGKHPQQRFAYHRREQHVGVSDDADDRHGNPL